MLLDLVAGTATEPGEGKQREGQKWDLVPRIWRYEGAQEFSRRLQGARGVDRVPLRTEASEREASCVFFLVFFLCFSTHTFFGLYKLPIYQSPYWAGDAAKQVFVRYILTIEDGWKGSY